MKKIILATLCLALLPLHSFAQSGLEFSRSSGDQNSLKEIREMIKNLESSIENMETFITNVKSCGDGPTPRLFNGTNCVTPTETDPSVAIHGKTNITNACSGNTRAQVFVTSSNTWTCKDFSLM